MSTKTKTRLPRGQKERDDFPRFGMPHYAHYVPAMNEDFSIQLGGDVASRIFSHQDLDTLERVELTADFHCVTTWSYRDVRWSGFRFKDFYDRFVQPLVSDHDEMLIATFAGLDRYRSTLFLEDALADEILLVDRMNGQPLSGDHGAPLRLVAPAHYGYKNVKHLSKINVWRTVQEDKRGIRKMMEHPRGRVAFEERGQFFPGWLLRYVYRPLINRTVRQFASASQQKTTQDQQNLMKPQM